MKKDPFGSGLRRAEAALDLGSACHAGRVRALNEDRFLLAPQSGIFAVADGMGGHEAGEVASAAVVEALAAVTPAASASDLLDQLKARLAAANSDIRKVGHARGAIVGTTVAILLVYEPHFVCLWSGDSRVYRVRAGAIAQLSRDHTEIQSLVERGVITPQEAQTWPRRNVITRAIGVQAEPEIDIDHGLLEAGDLFILCSDGLTHHVADGEILAAATGEQAERGAQAVCDALLQLTLERGAADNVTVVAVRYLGRSDAAAPARPPDAPEGSRA